MLFSSTVRGLPGKSPKTSGEVRRTSGEVQGLSRSSGEPDSLPVTRQICLQRKRNPTVHLPFVLQYTSHCTAVLLGKYWGLGSPESSRSISIHFAESLRKTQEGWNCRFQVPCTEGGDRSRQCRPPRPVPEILEFVAFCDSDKIFQPFSRDFRGVFLRNSRTATAFSSLLKILTKFRTLHWGTG